MIGVYDFGGGTFDTAVLRRRRDGFELAGSPGGDVALGGEDLDATFMEILAEHAEALDPDAWNELWEADRPGRRAAPHAAAPRRHPGQGGALAAARGQPVGAGLRRRDPRDAPRVRARRRAPARPQRRGAEGHDRPRRDHAGRARRRLPHRQHEPDPADQRAAGRAARARPRHARRPQGRRRAGGARHRPWLGERDDARPAPVAPPAPVRPAARPADPAADPVGLPGPARAGRGHREGPAPGERPRPRAAGTRPRRHRPPTTPPRARSPARSRRSPRRPGWPTSSARPPRRSAAGRPRPPRAGRSSSRSTACGVAIGTRFSPFPGLPPEIALQVLREGRGELGALGQCLTRLDGVAERLAAW